jgi:general secretion pathway protein H
MSLINRQRDKLDGFTLVELLVVVFLIGLISGFAVLSISSKGDDREIEDQLRLLQYQLTMASEESVMKGTPVGVQFDQGKYSFLIAGKFTWLELDDGKVFKAHELLRNWSFELEAGGEQVTLAENTEDSAGEELVPQIIFYSSGEIDPFELNIVDEDNTPRYRVRYGDDGVIVLESVDED